jgi:hypothetical protein
MTWEEPDEIYMVFIGKSTPNGRTIQVSEVNYHLPRWLFWCLMLGTMTNRMLFTNHADFSNTNGMIGAGEM